MQDLTATAPVAGVRVSVDIGGTFTDIVIQDAQTGRIETGKVLSTREDPARAVLEALERFVGDGRDLAFFVHGTTVGLNAVLERRGASTGLLMTDGLEQAYLIGGNDRPDIFDLRYRKPRPLIEADRIFAVPERLDADGSVHRPLDLEAVDAIAERVEALGLEALAVCLLYSFRDPAHELALEARLRERLDIPVILSHRVSPEWREYARASTTVMTAYMAPVVERYLTTLMEALERDDAPLHVMQSNGGVMSATTARSTPIQTLLSGPVGGAIGAREISRRLGRRNVVCVDMGGTSFDISLIVDGEATVSGETELDGLPIQMAAVDITGIGAGGGSIAWLEGRALRVGPESAGSRPGPVCYRQGGTRPTVTDANLALGRVDSDQFAGGGMDLDVEGARAAIAAIGEQIGLDADATAQGILDIVNAAMADAIRTQTVRRGIDPREFSLVAYGGAGPMHVAALAEELGIDEVIVPAHPGTFSAWGMLQTDVRHDFVETHFRPLEELDLDAAGAVFDRLREAGFARLDAEGVPSRARTSARSIDLRYVGQEYSLPVALDDGPIDVASVTATFNRAYQERYGHSNPGAPLEVVRLQVTVAGELDRPSRAPVAPPADVPLRTRAVSFGGAWVDATIASRPALRPGETVAGPAIVEETTATTVVPPGWIAGLADDGHLVLTRKEAAR